ncbi:MULTISPECIES: GNAT family N-acetyltransferase [unclassified Clostridium]|uniref:GNAT family N-acetyltransferase n=1 Tax=unclassified Clostridium TaxID=2614128 RepID=UPI003F8DA819
MEKIILVRPNKNFRESAEEYKREHFQYGENELPGSSLLNKLPYDKWLELIKNNSNEKTVTSDWVVSSTFFAVIKSNSKIIGMIDIRHTLNDFLKNYGGHIGYGVRPKERCKGYATQMLKLGLQYCKTIGLNKVMLGCNKDNLASRKTIINGGGVLEKEFVHSDGKTVQIFWISI